MCLKYKCNINTILLFYSGTILLDIYFVYIDKKIENKRF